MKMVLRTDEIGRATLSEDDDNFGGAKRVNRIFRCPLDGGYVLEHRDNDWKQVCDKLYGMGSTLMSPSRADLANVIRREYQAMRRAEQRQKRLDRDRFGV